MNHTSHENGLLFAVNPEAPARLNIQHLNGDVTITGWDRPAVEILTDDDEIDLSEILNVTQQGNDLSVSLDLGRGVRRERDRWRENWGRGRVEINAAQLGRMFRHLGHGAHLNLAIRVPYTCELHVRTVHGDLHLRQVQGSLMIENTAGDVVLQQVRGNVLVKTAAADVHVKAFEGRLGVRTASGDVRVEQGNLAALSVGSASGDIGINAQLSGTESYEVQSISGEIEIALPPTSRLTAEFETISGDIRCKLPHETERRSRRARVVHVNGGSDTRLRLRTTSGDVRITGGESWAPYIPAPHVPAGPAAEGSEPPAETRHFDSSEVAAAGAALAGDGERFRAILNADAGAPTDPKPTQRLPAQTTPATQLSILASIESGEITVEEGLRRLNDLAK